LVAVKCAHRRIRLTIITTQITGGSIGGTGVMRIGHRRIATTPEEDGGINISIPGQGGVPGSILGEGKYAKYLLIIHYL
jgi:hypothetical protein